ncbi:MAG: hypothetical protein Tp178MES00d2C33159091_54 [Prokaryotic dsDNA virus sp.]|uniref:hypothetical protein n=1 Tax=Thalassospira sp. TaxID=1912094 RepID=UPI0011895B47|nr:hypothetical protein [Thalassospira sp.]QDP61003.1 MAG: hypothetical protein Tp178MES00d2C33159091_54 [Prokaryotic dsDNA virus sp.]QDP64492.1 MAG: hypothetical protein Tp178SUR1139111_12 [Prokaryotic dsDNA virus sp.]|tara:strand:+ start:655 stop:1245 length:591 start_codon:yes stop_codon:yes gene_type:complete
MELREINARIRGIRTRREGTRVAIQECAVGIVEHANEHGDCSAAHRLCRAMEPKLRSQVVKWFTEISPINVKMGKTAADDKANLRKPEQNGYNAFNIDRARVLKWYELETPESAPKVYDLTSFREDVQKVLGRYAKMLEGDNAKITGAAADAIRADLAAFHEAIASNGQREQTPNRVNDTNPVVDAPLAAPIAVAA